MPNTVVAAVSTLGAAQSRHFPLGISAAPKGQPDQGANIAVYAPAHRHVVLCFQPPGESWRAILLPDKTDGVHHGFAAELPVGTRYGFYTNLEASREELLLIDPEAVQLLLDPYGRYIDEVTRADGSVRYLSVRMDSGFDWGTVTRPNTPWRETVFYEAHVRGQTMLHPEIPEEIRGSYAGMAHPVMIAHLLELGVTAVELLPVHFHLDEPHLQGTGMSNYWGYNTLGFFAPHAQYASAAAREAGPAAVQAELKGMVKLLHMAGIEVILDVVYNHTAEGGPGGPSLSWRGLAEEHYYRMRDGQYYDTTGCGNTLNFGNPQVMKMALDSLRYWVEEFHIDGFRFDLAVSLARNGKHEFDNQHPFLLAAAADSVLGTTKLISEPWDVGYGGWQTGNFPTGWADWNDTFRDTLRDIWLTDRATMFSGYHHNGLAKLGDALGGSSQLFAASGRSSMSSVNFVTAHDGFTLADLTAYNNKHNLDNQEENRDGNSNNRSWNHGVEGITNDEKILAQRARTSRNLMATMLLALGVPMLTAGDELGRSQGGNNNVYCQDNEIAWVDWSMDEEAKTMLAATRRLLKIRKDFLAAQPSGYPTRGGQSFIHWFGADGVPMSPEEWKNPHERVLTMLMGSPDGKVDGLVVFNTGITDEDVVLPANPRFDAESKDGEIAQPRPYMLRMTTAEATLTDDGEPSFRLPRSIELVKPGDRVRVDANTVQIYRNDLKAR